MEIILDITEKLHNDILDYCELNELDVVKFMGEMVKKGFMIEKFGKTPFANFDIPEPKSTPMDKEPEVEVVEKTKPEEPQIIEVQIVPEIKTEQVVETKKRRRLK